MSDKKNITLPSGITIEQLRTNWDTASAQYAKAFRRISMLDAADKGKLWEVLGAKFPQYQILTDTNFVSYIKNNLVAGIYTVGKSAQLMPTSENDMELVQNLNIMLDYYWDEASIGFLQMQAGERAALTNVAYVQVGWDSKLSGGNGDFSYKGGPVFKLIDPLKFMRDPYATGLETASYCMTFDVLHKNVLKSNPLYRDTLDAAILKCSAPMSPTSAQLRDGPNAQDSAAQKDYYTLVTHWIRNGDKYSEIHTLNNNAVLHVIEDLKPATFPFSVLYCNLPAGDLVGTSEPAKIFANNVAYNIVNSLLLTAEYKNQRPPKFINNMSGLNIRSFMEHCNDADATFIVSGDASKAVHYHQFPLPSNAAFGIMGKLGTDIQQVSGVDARYTGRDTGSLMTTGGIESMLDQVTLIDAPKVAQYEQFTKRLTQLVIQNLIIFAPKRKYFVKSKESPKVSIVDINFPEIDDDTVFQYTLNVSSELPKNKARLAQTANVLMEKQMQYQAGGAPNGVDYITPEEWLMMQDLPNKEMLQTRMGLQRNADYVEKVSQILFQYAGLVKSGMDPRDAIAVTAQQMQSQEIPGTPPPEEMIMPEQNPMEAMFGGQGQASQQGPSPYPPEEQQPAY